MAYATTEELERRYRPLSGFERTQADALLEDAAVWLDRRCDTAAMLDTGIGVDLLLMASCELVINAMNANGNAFGDAATGYADSGWAAAKAAGPMWLSKSTRDLLGIGAGRVGSVGVACHDD